MATTMIVTAMMKASIMCFLISSPSCSSQIMARSARNVATAKNTPTYLLPAKQSVHSAPAPHQPRHSPRRSPRQGSPTKELLLERMKVVKQNKKKYIDKKK